MDGTGEHGVWEKPDAESKVSLVLFQIVEFRGKEICENQWGLTWDIRGGHVGQEKEIYKGVWRQVNMIKYAFMATSWWNSLQSSAI